MNDLRKATVIAVQKARRHGQLVAQPCALCGRTPSEAHHEDYSRPLAVVWLCRLHHVWLHRYGSHAAEVAKFHGELGT